MSTLMVSISGIRGIVGGGLEPETIVKYTSAYADFVKAGTVVVGRDSRITGEMVKSLTIGTLLAKGLNVVDIGVCPTPTVQYTVKQLKAQGGIAISASHNPNQWNALKLLNSTGQFMTPDEHIAMKAYLNSGEDGGYKSWDKIGKLTEDMQALFAHKNAVLEMPIIDLEKIRTRKFKVVADCVNGAGAWIIPELLKDLGCEVIEMNCEKTGIFPRLPEPLPENLVETMKAVKTHGADLGVVVDPDVDRLVLITNDGEPFSEENTVTMAADFVLSKQKGTAVVNLSTTRTIEDVAARYGCKVYRSAVGEANVVSRMKEYDSIIGGEGSGGVIYPALHYGRDALVGIVLVLQKLIEFGGTISEYKKSLPQYYIAKKKIDLGNANPDLILEALKENHKEGKINTEDGLRIDFDDHWVHFRKSNTEPIIRAIVEAVSLEKATQLSEKYFTEISKFF